MVVALFGLEAETLIPFTGSFDRGARLPSRSSGALMEGTTVVGSTDD